jgi:hypothetical protein
MYAVTYEVPAGADMYQRVKVEIGEEQPDGMVVHFVVRTERGLQHYEVWDTKADWERFRDDRVRPAVDKVMASVGFTDPVPPPVENELEVIDVWRGVA